MTSELGLCEARIHALRADGTDRCRREAAHSHYAHATGLTLKLCTQHRNALVIRERRGSSEDMLRHWSA